MLTVRRIPPLALVVTLIVLLGLCPTRWIAPLTGDLSSVLWVPLSPLSHGATAARLWLRPRPNTPSIDEATAVAEREYYRGLWHAERIQTELLEKKLRLYEVTVGGASRGVAVRLASANVISRTPGSGGLALKVNVGSQHGIAAGDIAVVDGDAIVGRVAPEVGAVTSVVVSMADRSVGRFDAYIVPAAQEKSNRPQVIPVQLIGDGTGQVRGDIDLPSGVRPGDLVRLKDSQWPRGAQGMRVGVVTEVKRKDAQPLRGEVFVQPAIDPAMVGELVLKLSAGSTQ